MRRSFATALVGVIVAWTVFTAALLIWTGQQDTQLFADTVVISVASVVIAISSVLPGLLMQFDLASDDSQSQVSQLWGCVTVALAAGMMIRVVGTVALFLTYRYHMASSSEMIAGMTLGWYVILTAIEVMVLAKTLPKSASPMTERSSVQLDLPQR